MSRPPEGTASAIGARFVTAYTLAQIGAFIGFVPLLSVLLPIKAAGLAPDAASSLLSQVAVAGALAAGVSHLVVGALSDRTRSRFGRRKPWILAGAGLTTLSYAGVFWARTPLELMAAVILFQTAFNILFSPLSAVFADAVPDRRKGLVSAFSGLAYPVASLYAALVIAIGLADGPARYLAVAATLCLLIVPFCLLPVGDRGQAPAAAPGRPSTLFGAFVSPDFRMAFLSRLTVQTAISLNALYLFFYINLHSDASARLSGLRPDAVLGLLIASATLAALISGFGAGMASDRVGGRKGFVTAGAVGIAGGAALLALWPEWPGPLVAQVVYGVGLGMFTTADQALIAQVLPDRLDAGRDLGVMNIAVTAPQVLAPLLGIAMLDAAGWSLLSVFGVSAVLALGGGLIVQGVRRRV